jgi:hypothetical protein
MLQSISTLGKVLDKKAQRQLTGGISLPTNPEECEVCNGEWIQGGGLCALPIGSPCSGVVIR